MISLALSSLVRCPRHPETKLLALSVRSFLKAPLLRVRLSRALAMVSPELPDSAYANFILLSLPTLPHLSLFPILYLKKRKKYPKKH